MLFGVLRVATSPLLSRSAPRAALTRAAHACAQLAQAPATHWQGAVAPAPSPSGPIVGVPNAWRRKPGARETQVLVDASLADSLANLRFSCASPHGPPSPEALHRVLRRVAAPGDLEVVTKALGVARRAAMRVNEHTASLLVDAALRAGSPAYALDVFRRASELRIFPTASSFEKLLLTVIHGVPKDGGAATAMTALLADVARTLWLTRLPAASSLRLGGLVTAAHAALGDLPAALRAYAAFRRQQLDARAGVAAGAEAATRAGRPDARPLLHIARAIQAGSISAEALAAQADAMRGLVADARADCPDRPAVAAAADEVERLLPPPAAPADASAPAAEAAAPLAESPLA